jgi:hypothetical protein
MRKICLLVALIVLFVPVFAQSSSGEKTVEEAYLQSTLEALIIKEQAYSDNYDQKLIALQYIEEAIKNGRMTEDIRAALEYLASEGSLVITRSGGYGRPLNNYPDIRRQACLLLGNFKTQEAKDALLKIALADNEPTVIAAAIRSLGQINIIENDDVTQAIAFIINRFDILMPDNVLAFESLVALEAIADANNGIKDPAAIRAIMKIAEGNYITLVKQKAKDLLDKLRKMSASSGSGK